MRRRLSYIRYFGRRSNAAQLLLGFVAAVIFCTGGAWMAIAAPAWLLWTRRLSFFMLSGAALGILVAFGQGYFGEDKCHEQEFTNIEIYLSEVFQVEQNTSRLRGFADELSSKSLLADVPGRFIKTGVRIQASGQLRCLDTAGSGYHQYLSDRALNGIVGIRHYTLLEGEDLLHTIPNRIRDQVYRLSEDVPKAHDRQLLISLLLGSKYIRLDEDMSTRISTLGIAHLMAVSGFHVSILVEMVYAARSGIPKNYLELLVSGSVILFLLCIGVSNVSTLRAVLMILIATAASRLGCKLIKPWDMLVCAVATFLFYPAAWKLLAFQLSFGAVLSIRLFSRYLTLSFLPSWLSSSIAMSLSANLVSIPILWLAEFGELSIAGIISSIILVVPLSLLQAVGYGLSLIFTLTPLKAMFVKDIFVLIINLIGRMLKMLEDVLLEMQIDEFVGVLLFVALVICVVIMNRQNGHEEKN